MGNDIRNIIISNNNNNMIKPKKNIVIKINKLFTDHRGNGRTCKLCTFTVAEFLERDGTIGRKLSYSFLEKHIIKNHLVYILLIMVSKSKKERKKYLHERRQEKNAIYKEFKQNMNWFWVSKIIGSTVLNTKDTDKKISYLMKSKNICDDICSNIKSYL